MPTLRKVRSTPAVVAPTDTMCMIGYDQAFRLVVSGRAEDGLRLVNEMIPLAEHAGLEVGRALLLIWRGSARVELGDTDGVEDMRNAATTLARHGHQGTTAAYSNLADTVRSLGDMAGADAEYATAAEWASRFALPYYVDWVAAEQAYQAYHAARWDQAERLLAQMATPGRVPRASGGDLRRPHQARSGRGQRGASACGCRHRVCRDQRQRRVPLLRRLTRGTLPPGAEQRRIRARGVGSFWHAGMESGGSPAGRSNCARPPPSSPSPVITPRSATLPCCSPRLAAGARPSCWRRTGGTPRRPRCTRTSAAIRSLPICICWQPARRGRSVGELTPPITRRPY